MSNTYQLTRKHTNNGIKYGYSKKHGWMLYYDGALACLSGWLPCTPKHIQ